MVEENKSISETDVLNIIKSVKYGSVEVTIHDSKIVQLERKEKLRAITKPAQRG